MKRIKKMCPLDKKICDVSEINDEEGNPFRLCRHGGWNSNIETPTCGKEMFRKSKQSKSKSKRKKCGCK